MEMTFEQVMNICRGCLAGERRMISTTLYEAVFRDLTGIIISPSDGLPKWLCYECSALLMKFVRFRNKITESHYILCQYLLKNTPFEYKENRRSHLTRTSVKCYDFSGSETKNEENKEQNADSIVTSSNITIEIENIEIKQEILSDDDSMEAESRGENSRKGVTSHSSFGFDTPKASTETLKHETETKGSEAEDQIYTDENRDTDEEYTEMPLFVKIENVDVKVEKVSDSEDNVTPSSDERQTEQGETSRLEPRGGTPGAPPPPHVPEHMLQHMSLWAHIPEHLRPATQTSNPEDIEQDEDGKTDNISENSVGVYPTEKMFKCEVCYTCFYTKAALDDHSSEHADFKPFYCDICSKYFSQKRHLDRHHRTHVGDKPYQCTICMKCFGRNDSLDIHYRTHAGDKPYKCEICMKCFSVKYNLDVHYRIHTGAKPYNCEICMKSFSLKSNLDVHYRIHNGDKPYKCEICTKCFNSKSNLNKHNLIHVSDKPHKCDVCLKCFIQKGDLDRHYRKHTGDKPFKCEVCLKCFSDRSSYNVHCRKHVAVITYQCELCPKSYSTKYLLNKHCLRIHANEGVKPKTELKLVK